MSSVLPRDTYTVSENSCSPPCQHHDPRGPFHQANRSPMSRLGQLTKSNGRTTAHSEGLDGLVAAMGACRPGQGALAPSPSLENGDLFLSNTSHSELHEQSGRRIGSLSAKL